VAGNLLALAWLQVISARLFLNATDSAEITWTFLSKDKRHYVLN
jgi:hypothetical protein